MHPASSQPPRGPGGTRTGNRRPSASRWGVRPGTWPTGIRRAIRIGPRPEAWKRGPVLAALALLVALAMLLHGEIPDWRWNAGSLAETFLPWFGLLIPVLLAGALWRRSPSALAALLLPAVVWLNLFGGALSDKSRPGGFLTVASENVNAGNLDPARSARDLAACGADVLALVELTPQAAGIYEKGLAKAYPYHALRGTVGLWSKLTVYVAHPGSVRVNPRAGFWTASRDIGVRALGRAIAADPSKRLVLLGDLNGTMGDRAFAVLTAQLHSAQEMAGDGFGFTWPASFPMVRIDQILVRGAEPDSSWVRPANGSDHRPVEARISW